MLQKASDAIWLLHQDACTAMACASGKCLSHRRREPTTLGMPCRRYLCVDCDAVILVVPGAVLAKVASVLGICYCTSTGAVRAGADEPGRGVFRSEVVGSLCRRELSHGDLVAEFRALAKELAKERFRLPDADVTKTISVPTLECSQLRLSWTPTQSRPNRAPKTVRGDLGGEAVGLGLKQVLEPLLGQRTCDQAVEANWCLLRPLQPANQ